MEQEWEQAEGGDLSAGHQSAAAHQAEAGEASLKIVSYRPTPIRFFLRVVGFGLRGQTGMTSRRGIRAPKNGVLAVDQFEMRIVREPPFVDLFSLAGYFTRYLGFSGKYVEIQ